MNKLITFIIASFVRAASAFADVGESPAVSLAEWRKLGVIPQGWEPVEGQPCLSGQTSDGNMATHVFTVDRKYNIACILVGAPVTQGMIEHLKQSAPMNTWEQVYYNDTDGGMWRSSFKRGSFTRSIRFKCSAEISGLKCDEAAHSRSHDAVIRVYDEAGT